MAKIPRDEPTAARRPFVFQRFVPCRSGPHDLFLSYHKRRAIHPIQERKRYLSLVRWTLDGLRPAVQQRNSPPPSLPVHTRRSLLAEKVAFMLSVTG